MPTFVLTFLLYGGLNQIMFRCLRLLPLPLLLVVVYIHIYIYIYMAQKVATYASKRKWKF
jgi:hypothetical protein